MKTLADIGDEWLANVRRREHAPLVRFVGNYYEFYRGKQMIYDVEVASYSDALRLLQVLTEKNWVTREHLSAFVGLLCKQFKVRRV